MKYPQRDIIPQGDTGGANYMDVQVPGRSQPGSTLTTAGTGTMVIKQKRNSKSYKTLFEEKSKENNSLVKKLIGVSLLSICLGLMVLFQILYWLNSN